MATMTNNVKREGNDFHNWFLYLATSVVNGEVHSIHCFETLLTECHQYVNITDLSETAIASIQQWLSRSNISQGQQLQQPQQQQQQRSPRESRRPPKRTLGQMLIQEDDGSMPKRFKGQVAQDASPKPSWTDIVRYAEHLKVGFGQVLGSAILYFLKLFYHPNPPIAHLKRAGVIESMFQIMQNNPNETMVAGSMIVLNYFVHIAPIEDISPLRPDEVCDAVMEALDTHHNQIVIEASLMIRNLVCILGRENILKKGVITTLFKTISVNRENEDIVVACLRALQNILYGETPPPDKAELQQLLQVLRNIIYKDSEVIVFYAASVLSNITMYENLDIARYILSLNLHSAMVQLLDVNPRIKRVALLLLEDMSYAADNDSEVYLALVSKPKLLPLLNEIAMTSLRKTELMSAGRTLCNLCTGNTEVIQFLLNGKVFASLTHFVLHFYDYDVTELVCWALYFAVENCTPQQLPLIATTPGFFAVIGRGFDTFDDRDKFECELCLKLMVTLARVLQKAAANETRVQQVLNQRQLDELQVLGESKEDYVRLCAKAVLEGNYDDVFAKAAKAPPATPGGVRGGGAGIGVGGSSSSSIGGGVEVKRMDSESTEARGRRFGPERELEDDVIDREDIWGIIND